MGEFFPSWIWFIETNILISWHTTRLDLKTRKKTSSQILRLGINDWVQWRKSRLVFWLVWLESLASQVKSNESCHDKRHQSINKMKIHEAHTCQSIKSNKPWLAKLRVKGQVNFKSFKVIESRHESWLVIESIIESECMDG